MSRRPESLHPVDYALLVVSLIAWALAFVEYENAGRPAVVWGELGVAYGFFAIYLVREVRRLSGGIGL